MRVPNAPLRKIISFILVFLLGFISCVGAIAGGGYLIYTKVSYNTLLEWGWIKDNLSDYVSEDAEVSLSAMTLQGLVDEIMTLSKMDSELTIDVLTDRYGLKLTDEAYAKIPDGMKTVDIRKIFTQDGINHILENTYIDYIFEMVPTDVLSEPARETLGGKTLKGVAEADLTYLLEDVDIGYIMGVDYVKVDGVYEVRYADKNNPTFSELIAPISTKKLLDAATDGKGDFLKVMNEDIGDAMVESLLSNFVNLDDMGVPGLFEEDDTLSEVIKYDEDTGKYVFDFKATLEERTIGEILGYTPIYLENPMPVSDDTPAQEPIIIGWLDKDNNKVTGIMRGVSCQRLSGLSDDTLTLDTLLVDSYFGDVMGYEPVAFDETGAVTDWRDSEGNPPETALKNIVNKSVNELTSGDFVVADFFEGLYVGDLLGYVSETELDGEGNTVILAWYDEDEDGNRIKIEGMDDVIADIDLHKLLDEDSDYDVSDIFDDVLIGELLDYERVQRIEGGNPVYELDEHGQPLLDENGDKIPVYDWYEVYDEENPENNKLVTGIMKVVSNKTINTFDNSIVDEITVADVMDYRLGNDEKWYDSEGNQITGMMATIAGKYVGSLETEVNTIMLGEIMGYTKCQAVKDGELVYKTDDNGNFVLDEDGEKIPVYEWFEDSDCTIPAKGVTVSFAHLTINEMTDDEKVTEAVNNVVVGEALGYTKVEESGKEVWYEVYDENNPENNKLVTGIMEVLVDKKVSELDAQIKEITVADVMDYHKDEHGNWVTATNESVNGLMSAIADDKINQLDAHIDRIYIGEAMNYTRVNEGTPEVPVYVWYEEYHGEGSSENKAPSGLMASFTHLTISDLRDEQKVKNTVNSIKLGDLFDESSFDSGFLSLLSPEATISELSGEKTDAGSLSHTFINKPISEFMEAGLIELDADTVTALDYLDDTKGIPHSSGWRSKNINEFISYIVSH